MDNKNESNRPQNGTKKFSNPSQNLPVDSASPSASHVRVSARLDAQKGRKPAAQKISTNIDNNDSAMAKTSPAKVSLQDALAAHAALSGVPTTTAPTADPTVLGNRKIRDEHTSALRSTLGRLPVSLGEEHPSKKQKFLGVSKPRLTLHATAPIFDFGETVAPKPQPATEISLQSLAAKFARLEADLKTTQAENAALRRELNQLQSTLISRAFAPATHVPTASTTDTDKTKKNQKNQKNQKPKKITTTMGAQQAAPPRPLIAPPQPPPTPATVQHSSWATVVSKKKTVPNPTRTNRTNTTTTGTTTPTTKPARARPTKAQAIRALQEPTGPSKYTYVYLNSARHLRFREVRDMLRAVKVPTSRVIDISFPARGTIALLVHQAYAPSLKKLMRQEGVKTADDFNPLDAKVVGDPRHATKSEEEKRALARHYYVERIKNTCAAQRLRPHLAISIARFFCFEQEGDLKLPEAAFRDILAAHNPGRNKNPEAMVLDPPATTPTTNAPAPTSISTPTNRQ